MSEKELLWLPIELAKRVKDVTDSEAINNEILSYVEQTKKELQIGIESIDEDIVLYRAHMIKARNAFKEAKDQEIESMYSLWEEYDKELTKVRGFVNEAKKAIEPIKEEVIELNKEMEKINHYGFANMIETVYKFCQLYGEQREMMEFLIKNFKKEPNHE